MHEIWIPEIEVPNIVEKTADLGLSGGSNFVIMDGCSGLNTLVVSYQLENSCPLDFSYYPYDRQVLQLLLVKAKVINSDFVNLTSTVKFRHFMLRNVDWCFL